MRVRVAEADDHLAVMNVLDAAMLAADAAEVQERIDADDVLVAVDDERVLGAIVLDPRDDGAFVESVAVRRARRGQGIGTALVERAGGRYGRLTAECDERVRPFYASMGFEIERASDDRLRGSLSVADR
ncbi:GNAT family N-acetyltransferase [Halomicrococcus gelatinilyticus]|uniref:GNAT family N-acetyltransferase n=1 Tax=Halomicrococcus gelatinilyticus TaxID=1702103 RepID=UPI002E11FF3A